ncbi:MAG: hypothetical protein ACTSQJ_19160 [Promethearchaeota archaeon]
MTNSLLKNLKKIKTEIKKSLASIKNIIIYGKDLNYLDFINTPIKFFKNKLYIGGGIIEQIFVLNNIDLNGLGKRFLDFGCAKKYLALQLASLGYEVVAIDLRKYKFNHPNLKFYQKNLLNFEDEQGFD